MTPEHPERALILAYAPARARAGLAALLSLDDALARLLRTTREPALGQIRLAWWREALERLDTAPPPAEPVLQALAAELVAKGVSGASLVAIVHGWEVLIEEEALDRLALERFARGRGHLFVAAGTLAGATRDPLDAAGRGWALADLARNLSSGEEAELARTLAAPLLDEVAAVRWSQAGRGLGALAHRARLDLAEGADRAGSPRRVGRLLWHRLTGR